MKTDRLAGLHDRLATSSAEEMAVVAVEGLALAWPTTQVVPDFPVDLVASCDKALALIAKALPGWGVVLDGTATTKAAWTCTLRDNGLRDDDEVIGIGQAATPPLAMIIALLRVLTIRSRGYV